MIAYDTVLESALHLTESYTKTESPSTMSTIHKETRPAVAHQQDVYSYSFGWSVKYNTHISRKTNLDHAADRFTSSADSAACR